MPPSYPCPYPQCGKSFPKPAKLEQHIRSHTGERPYVCDYPECGASYMRNEHLKAHQRQHLDPSLKPHKCSFPSCEKTFWTSSQLKNHVNACHPNEQVIRGIDPSDHVSNRNPCDGSQTEPSSTSGIPATDKYICIEHGCGRWFHKRSHLRQHIREHHSDLHLLSQTCQTVSSLSGQDPSTINPIEQDQELSRKLLLPFACSYPGCSMRFQTNSKRNSHAKTHQQGRYTCSMEHSLPQDPSNPHCGESIGPDGSQSYVYTFPNWSSLQAHMKAAHPPTCPWPGCGRTFQRHDGLRSHYKRHEARKLRLELEAKIIEIKSKTERNQFRLDALESDHSSCYSDRSDDSSDEGNPIHPVRPSSNGDSGALTPNTSISVSEEQDFVMMASNLCQKRPRRSNAYRELVSPSPSVLTKLSESAYSSSLFRLATTGQNVAPSGSSVGAGTDGLFRCTWNGCNKSFTRSFGLSIHIRTSHLGEKPFECPGCQKRFSHKHLVSRHRRICPAGPESKNDPPSNPPDELANVSGQPLTPNPQLPSHPNLGQYIPVAETPLAGQTESETLSKIDPRLTSATTSNNEEGYQQSPPAELPSIAQMARTRLLDLLTGAGYATASETAFNSSEIARPSTAIEDGEPAAKKRRTTRNRIFDCPWHSIVRLVQQTDGRERENESETRSAEDSLIPNPIQESSKVCSYKFKRIYDLRRHLKSSHSLELDDDQVRAWIKIQQP